MATYRSQELLVDGLRIVADGEFVLQAYANDVIVDETYTRVKVEAFGSNNARLKLDSAATFVVPANTRLTSIKLIDPVRGLEMGDEINVNFDTNSLYTMSNFEMVVTQL